MVKITLCVLAEDIRTTNYSEAYDCAMTRALRRANIDAYECAGRIYCTRLSETMLSETIPTPEEMKEKVLRMYAHLDTSEEWLSKKKPLKWTQVVVDKGTLEPADFTQELEVPSEWMN